MGCIYWQSIALNHSGAVNSVTFSPDGKYIATASDDNTARVWNVSTGKRIIALTMVAQFDSVTFSPDGRYIATASNDNTACVWNVSTGKEIIISPLKHEGVVNKVVLQC